jgi:hypothetical protein
MCSILGVQLWYEGRETFYLFVMADQSLLFPIWIHGEKGTLLRPFHMNWHTTQSEAGTLEHHQMGMHICGL